MGGKRDREEAAGGHKVEAKAGDEQQPSRRAKKKGCTCLACKRRPSSSAPWAFMDTKNEPTGD
eukprot:12355671-Prorocentrum_lima.AAC.1